MTPVMKKIIGDGQFIWYISIKISVSFIFKTQYVFWYDNSLSQYEYIFKSLWKLQKKAKKKII